MKKVLFSLIMICGFTALALADVSLARLESVKHRRRHHHTNRHANRAEHHHAQHRRHYSV
ncbi:MAG TPA: hypothetical protein VMS18_23680 [Candidatus Binatia bacterium]|nr:hypothetical protein [Candidatus Binatia bacterium]